MRDVFVLAAYSTPFGKFPGVPFTALTGQAVRGVLADAVSSDTGSGDTGSGDTGSGDTGSGDTGSSALGPEVGSVWFGNMMMSYWGQPSTRGQFCLIPLIEEGMLPERVPIVNVEGACATGSMAFQGAVKDVRSGEHELALAVGVEKIVRPDAPPGAIFEMYRGAENSLDPDRTLGTYRSLMSGIGLEFETGQDRTVFMDTYAAQALHHMHRFGTTQRQLAAVAAKNHNYAVHNERAQYRFPLTVEEVLADRLVTPPLTRAMCAPVGDGAAAVLVCSADFLAGQPEPVRRRALRVAASTLTSGVYRAPDAPSLSRVASERAYARAGVSADAIDVAEVHDATAFSEIFQTEMLGFCAEGEGGELAESGETGPGGRIPVNTSGGLLSKGHPVGASGLSMLTEVTVQLRGEAGPRQVPGAARGLVENGGGIMGLEEAACAVTILERG